MMLNKLYKAVTLAAVAGLALAAVAATPLAAQDVSGKDVQAIVQPSGDWREIKANELDVYQVNYDFTQDGDTTTSDVVVELEMGEEDSVGFNVYTPEQLAQWQNGETVDPMGVGSDKPGQSDDLPKTKLIWTSSSHGNETFYIVVGNKQSDKASYYDITITGSGISYPVGTASAPAPAAEEEAAADADAEGDAEAAEGADEEAAADEEADADADADVMETAKGQLYEIGTPIGTWKSLGPRQGDWYQIDYKYLESDGQTVSEAYVELEMDVCDAISFSVYTPDEVQQWIDGEKPTPVGEGTPTAENSDFSATNDNCRLTWDNTSTASETFYIVVKNESNAAADYLLTITGNGVSFPMGAHEVQSAAAEEPAADEDAETETADADAETEEAVDEEVAEEDAAPASGLLPVGEWDELAPRQKAWYQVNYHFIPADDAGSSDLYVQLDMGEENTVGFKVYTPDELAQWQNGEDYEPIGQGTQPADFNDEWGQTRLSWESTAEADQIFYIVVSNLVDVPSYFDLTVEGQGLTFPMGGLQTNE